MDYRKNDKLQLSHCQKAALLKAADIADLAKILPSHTYRIVKDPAIHLTDTVRELLTIKALGQIPGLEIGWRFDARNQQMITPEGKLLHCADLENYALAQQMIRHWETLATDNDEALCKQQKQKRIQEPGNQLSLLRKLQLYVNGSLKQRRSFKAQDRDHLKVVSE